MSALPTAALNRLLAHVGSPVDLQCSILAVAVAVDVEPDAPLLTLQLIRLCAEAGSIDGAILEAWRSEEEGLPAWTTEWKGEVPPEPISAVADWHPELLSRALLAARASLAGEPLDPANPFHASAERLRGLIQPVGS